jgi:hypothetical protein
MSSRPFLPTRRRRVSSVPESYRDAFEALVTEEYRPEHEAIGPEALGALEECSDVMPTELCCELHLPRDSTYADGVVAYCDSVTYESMTLSQLAAVAKESEAAGIQFGILQVLCALRGDREAFAVLGDEWTPLLRDAVHTALEAEQHPAGPKEFFRARKVVQGDDDHLTDDEFDAEWGWWS